MAFQRAAWAELILGVGAPSAVFIDWGEGPDISFPRERQRVLCVVVGNPPGCLRVAKSGGGGMACVWCGFGWVPKRPPRQLR